MLYIHIDLLRIIFIAVLCYNFYLTFAFYRFTKDNKEKVSIDIGLHHVWSTPLYFFTFFFFTWYFAILIIIASILGMGTLSSKYGEKIDKFIFKYQWPFLALDLLLIVFVINQYFKT